MRNLTRKLCGVAAIATAALAAAPASAGYYVTYWADYVGGRLNGYQTFCDGGALYDQGGTLEGIQYIAQGSPGSPPC